MTITTAMGLPLALALEARYYEAMRVRTLREDLLRAGRKKLAEVEKAAASVAPVERSREVPGADSSQAAAAAGAAPGEAE